MLMTAHELARKLLEMKDCLVEIRNYAGEMEGTVEDVRYFKYRGGLEVIQIDSDCLKNDEEVNNQHIG